MKIRIQFTPALTAALLCAAGWFSLWLFAFQPALRRPETSAPRPEVTRLVTDDETFRQLKTPTLFALPSDAGFSGRFLENQVTRDLTLEKTNSPVRYLPPGPAASPGVDRRLLMTATALPESELPAPGAAPRTAIRPAAGTQLFLSPELQARAGDIPLHLAADGPDGTVRVNLSVRADGTVEYAFFETPVTNAALLSAVRKLPFKPAGKRTEGWMDIRFAQEEK